MNSKGYSIVELIVVVAIFLIITSVVLINQNKFSSDINLNNAAYELSLAIRKAQVYGLSVRGESGLSNSFDSAFGMSFDSDSTKSFIFFSDSVGDDGVYTEGSDSKISTFVLENGTYISGLCTYRGNSANCVEDLEKIYITFKRPNPEAIIKDNKSDNTEGNNVRSRAEITISSALGHKTKKVIVTNTGQIYNQ